MGRRKPSMPDMAMDMTPMIDIVFQLIIFFVVTADMANQAAETQVRMALAPHGAIEEQKDPRTVTVDVEKDGKIVIMKMALSPEQLYAILVKARNESGQSTPVVIRGDYAADHESIRRVMDVCGRAGLWKIRFAALKEKA